MCTSISPRIGGRPGTTSPTEIRSRGGRVGAPGGPPPAAHRPAPSCIPVYVVKTLRETTRELKKRGWKPDGGRFEIPNGPCYAFEDPSGNRFAIFENVRPAPFE